MKYYTFFRFGGYCELLRGDDAHDSFIRAGYGGIPLFWQDKTFYKEGDVRAKYFFELKTRKWKLKDTTNEKETTN